MTVPPAVNLSWITDDLAVGGSFRTDEAEHLARELRIKAVVDLRGEACDDTAVLKRHGITFLHLPTEDHCAVSAAMLDAGVAFAGRHLEASERVLIHCQHGIGRSALLALCVLVSRGHEPLAALRLAKARRSLVSPSPAQYEAWAEWLEAWKAGTGAGFAIPCFDDFAVIAYSHLRTRVG